MGTQLPSPEKGAEPSNFRPIFIVAKQLDASRCHLVWSNGGRPQRGDFVLDGDPALTPKVAELHPIFGPRLLWPNGCMDQDATWKGVRPRLRDIVFDVDPATPEKRHNHPTQFLAHVYCGPVAGWTKTPLGTVVDVSPGHIVLDGVPAPAKGAQQPPSFRPMCIVATVAHLSYC